MKNCTCDCVYTPYPAGSKLELGVASLGVSVTTMEEVFLKVRDENQESIQQRYIYNIIKANWCVSTFPTNQLYVVKAKGYVSTTLRVY